MTIRRIAALATSYNRKDMTLASLQSIFTQRGVEGLDLTVFMVDDGSTDGTGDAIAARFPQVRLLRGDGNLYWNGGMRKAFATALQERYDAYLWINDDSFFFDDALARLVACAESHASKGIDAIAVGSMRDPSTGALTYGGFIKRKDRLSLHFDPVIPDETDAIACDTMNGNFALIPAPIAQAVGNLDEIFHHQIGDLDYGMRTRKKGFSVIVAPGYFGECSWNSAERTWRDPSLSRRKRWQHLMSPKGAPLREWVPFTYRHYGWRWPLYALSPYIKTLFH